MNNLDTEHSNRLVSLFNFYPLREKLGLLCYAIKSRGSRVLKVVFPRDTIAREQSTFKRDVPKIRVVADRAIVSLGFLRKILRYRAILSRGTLNN